MLCWGTGGTYYGMHINWKVIPIEIKIDLQGMVAQAFNPSTGGGGGGRSRQICLQQVPGQLRLHKKALSWKTNKLINRFTLQVKKTKRSFVLVCFPAAVIKHWPKATFEEERAYYILQAGVHHGGRPGKELEACTAVIGTWRNLLTGLLSGSCSSAFLPHSRTTCPGWYCPQ